MPTLWGLSVEETAKAILTKSCSKIVPVIEDLIAKYKIEREQIVLVGAGGGAGTLLTFTANMLGFKYQIPENAEVISSIGVALALVREMVERTIPNPTASDIAQIKKEAKELAMNSGAVEDSIEVYVEIDDQTQKVTAIAMGSTEVKTTDLMKHCTREETVAIAAESLGIGYERSNNCCCQRIFACGDNREKRQNILFVLWTVKALSRFSAPMALFSGLRWKTPQNPCVTIMGDCQ